MKNLTSDLPALRAVKLLDQLRERIRYLHYSIRTEEAYVYWVRAFIRYHGRRHPGRWAVRKWNFPFVVGWRTPCFGFDA
ncbi:MAG: phage integrase N-terminal SAM-like domain-containing protein [Rhodocyclaceae bacterium]|nr:phage integrase N-terminal SAM-like domain-containing protein [Rhodocyclaceae bacterium]